MWRTNGEGELYTYLPSHENPGFEANRALCNVAPSSNCNSSYGASVGRGTFNFKSGEWNTVSQRLRLNDVGRSNGELELFFDGKSVINVGGLKFRNNARGCFRGLQVQTFFGGKHHHSPLFCCVPFSHMGSLQDRSPNSLPQNPKTPGSPTSPWQSQRPSRRPSNNLRQPTPDNARFPSLCVCPMVHFHAHAHSLQPTQLFPYVSLAFPFFRGRSYDPPSRGFLQRDVLWPLDIGA